jgi:hypothetical protein
VDVTVRTCCEAALAGTESVRGGGSSAGSGSALLGRRVAGVGYLNVTVSMVEKGGKEAVRTRTVARRFGGGGGILDWFGW